MTTAKIRTVNKPVGTSAGKLIEEAEAPPNARGDAGFICKAPSTNTQTVFVGGADVTIANGFPLDPGEFVAFPLNFLSGLHAVAAAGGQAAAVIYG